MNPVCSLTAPLWLTTAGGTSGSHISKAHSWAWCGKHPESKAGKAHTWLLCRVPCHEATETQVWNQSEQAKPAGLCIHHSSQQEEMWSAMGRTAQQLALWELLQMPLRVLNSCPDVAQPSEECPGPATRVPSFLNRHLKAQQSTFPASALSKKPPQILQILVPHETEVFCTSCSSRTAITPSQK